jgi:hypothetical protein
MKKVFLALAVIAMIGLASCAKTKICHCYYDYSGVLGSGTQDLGLAETQTGDCTDLENGTNFNFNYGDLGTGNVRCEKAN